MAFKHFMKSFASAVKMFTVDSNWFMKRWQAQFMASFLRLGALMAHIFDSAVQPE
ncbi:hypothetical protein IV71_GL000519 [Fructobacillus fructosus KCTC 3544]|nr:hypothetical protein IV71_GL000519 [Fructobacillus fructosus KCTC 3544]